MTAVSVRTPVLEWAQHRSGRDDEDMRTKFANWDRWLAEDARPSFSDVEDIAAFTRVPVGYLFLQEPPVEELPIPDFRVGRGVSVSHSDDLLETIYLNQRRQAWYEDYLLESDEADGLGFVGSAQNLPVTEAAGLITEALGYGLRERESIRTIDGARSYLISAFEELGGLVVLNSMVGNNTHRMLDIEEFRGFTLHSLIAPLVFVNARDTKRGQVFSLLHEFAHVWRGESGVSYGGEPLRGRATEVERWCDAVAAEIAVPHGDLRVNFDRGAELIEELDRLADRYRCSTLVILLRLRQTGLLREEGFSSTYDAEVERLMTFLGGRANAGGGDFYNNQPFRIGRTLSRALIRAARSDRIPMTEAARLMGFRSVPMIDQYASRLGEP